MSLKKKPAPMPKDFAKRIVCLRLEMKRLGNRRKIAESQYEVDADKSMTSASKKLLDSPELTAIKNFDGETKRFVRAHCLPHPVKGVHMMPLLAAEDIVNGLEKRFDERLGLVAALKKVYEQRCAESKKRLKRLWDPSEYVPVKLLDSFFVFFWQIVSFETPDNLAKSVSMNFLKKAKRQEMDQLVSARDEAIDMMRQGFSVMMQNLKEELSETKNKDGKKRVLKKAAVENLQKFIAAFPMKNDSLGDTDLEALVKMGGEAFKGLDAEKIRNNEGLRKSLTKTATAITKQMSKLVEVEKTRVIQDDED